MEQMYNDKMQAIGYNQLVCDIFLNWEDVKDEILLPDRKLGSGNGTVHVFLGAADAALRTEFFKYYTSVEKGEDTSVQAVKVKHVFTKSNVLSMLGYVCQYYKAKGEDYDDIVNSILGQLEAFTTSDGLITTESLFKLSTGSNKLRPYFKQFDDKGAFHKVIRQLLLPQSAYKISLYKNNVNEYAAFWLIGFSELNDFEADSSKAYLQDAPKVKEETCHLQQIFYGAPGTGKSYTINQDTEGEDVIRTTFHPDTDYSTFVGAYKPTTIEEEVMTVIGTKAVPVENADGSHRKESKIVYEFVQQAFLQAYVAAWKKYAEANGEEPRKQFLVIEEINRGNCAQIFGDMFQLLDRNAQGFSDYPITADADMKRQLKKAFAGLSLAKADSINAMYKGRDVCREVLEGDILLLPGNLYIWATMNTSDQSLFPIDSAFKRRWDWTYRPISDAKEEWKIKAYGNLYDWWTFLEKINDKVGSLTNSEDKKLGYFFCKADSENIISADTFVGKVIFYLWNDVFKDYEFGDTIFDDGKGGKLTFDRFYVADTAHETKVVEDNIALFLNNLDVEPIPTEITSTADTVNTTSVIKVNGKEIKKINAIPYTVIEEYVKLNQDKTAQEVIDVWEPFKKYSMRSWIVAKKEELANMDERYANYSYQIHCADGNSLWVNKDGWMHRPTNPALRDTINEFIHAVNEANLGVTITEENI